MKPDHVGTSILADGSKSYRPDSFDVSFMGTEARFKFNSYKILDQDEMELQQNPNPFAVVVLTALLALKNRKVDDERLLSIKRELYMQMISRDMSVDCMRGVYDFLARYVHFENQENMFKFEDQLKDNFGGDTTMGIAEILLEDARKQGRAEAEIKYELQMRNAVVMLKKAGVSIMEICQNLDLKKSQVEQLLKNT